ncbi:MAG: GNAT family N-acetyltransferase [Bdellovibrio sp.]|nr:MAG: GNAT family N-acetyltransferase [Bdellovibrio sp.]
MSTVLATQHRTKTGETIVIRSAEGRDAAQILALGKSVMDEGIYTLTESDELDFTVEQEAEWIRSHQDHPAKLILVAEFEERVVGILDFSNGHRRRIAHHGEFGMSVMKPWRDKGVGKALLGSLLAWAERNLTIEKINLKVHATNSRAIGLYEKFGFVEEGRQKRDLRLARDQYVDSILMGRFVK